MKVSAGFIWDETNHLGFFHGDLFFHHINVRLITSHNGSQKIYGIHI